MYNRKYSCKLYFTVSSEQSSEILIHFKMAADVSGTSTRTNSGLAAESDSVTSFSEATCSRCLVTSSSIWRRTEGGDVMCLECYTVHRKTEKERADHQPTPPPVAGKKRGRTSRKGSRAEKGKAAVCGSGHITLQQGMWVNGRVQVKGRRSLAKVNTRVRRL